MCPKQEVGLFCLPLQQVRVSLARIVGLSVCLLLLMALPARGQIISVVDERGKRVFINWEKPKPAGKAIPGKTPAAKSQVVQPASRVAVVTSDSGTRTYSKAEIERIVQAAAERHRVDPALVRAVIRHESDWNPEAVSRKGAQGLMQLMPATAEQHGVGNAFDPEQNVNAGVRHLRKLLERYNGDLDKALAAYNAGERAVDRAKGVPNYPETQAYVQKITNTYFQPGSGRASTPMNSKKPIYRTVDARGKVIFTNE